MGFGPKVMLASLAMIGSLPPSTSSAAADTSGGLSARERNAVTACETWFASHPASPSQAVVSQPTQSTLCIDGTIYPASITSFEEHAKR